MSFIVQFQFYEALCIKSGQYTLNGTDPLFSCDFSKGGEETGQLIRDMMQNGFSKSWPQVLEEMTGTPEMSASSFLKYFLHCTTFWHKKMLRMANVWVGEVSKNFY